MDIHKVADDYIEITPDGPMVDETGLEIYVEEEVTAYIRQEMHDHLGSLPSEFSDLISYADTIEINVIGAEETVSSYLEPDISDFYEYVPSESDLKEDEIDYIFQR